MSLILAVEVLLVLLILLLLLSHLYQHIRYKLPPGPRPWPIIGNLYDLSPVRCQCLYQWAQRYGPIVSFWVGSKLNVVVSNSELAREVLKEHDKDLSDRHRGESFGTLTKEGKELIWADYGPHFVKVRKFATLQLFSQKRVQALRHIRDEEIVATIASISSDCTNTGDEGKALELRRYLEALSLNHITRLTFGKRFVDTKGGCVDDPLIKRLNVLLAHRDNLNRSLSHEYVATRSWWSLIKNTHAMAVAELDYCVKQIMDDYAHTKTKVNEEHFLDALVSHKDEFGFCQDTVTTLLWDMVVAGKDTMAITVEWAIAELMKNPQVQQKAQEELDRVVGHERSLTENDISNLPYLQAITKETLRLHPPTSLLLPHKAKKHVQVGGYDIPKGTVLHVNVWAMGRDSNEWDNPTEFRPERFLEKDVDMMGHDFRLLPFGSGRRICPGAQMSIPLVTSTLGHLLHQFVWNLPNGVEPKGIHMVEAAGIITYMQVPLQTVPVPRLSPKLLK